MRIRIDFLSDPDPWIRNPELCIRIRIRILPGNFCGHYQKYVVKLIVYHQRLKKVGIFILKLFHTFEKK